MVLDRHTNNKLCWNIKLTKKPSYINGGCYVKCKLKISLDKKVDDGLKSLNPKPYFYF